MMSKQDSNQIYFYEFKHGYSAAQTMAFASKEVVNEWIVQRLFLKKNPS